MNHRLKCRPAPSWQGILGKQGNRDGGLVYQRAGGGHQTGLGRVPRNQVGAGDRPLYP